MKLVDAFKKELIFLDFEAPGKVQSIVTMASLIANTGCLDKKDQAVEVAQALLDRERLGSTGFGKRIAIPHTRNHAVKDLVVAVFISRHGIDFESADYMPANVFFTILVPYGSSSLKFLATLSRMLREKKIIECFVKATSQDEVYDLIASFDR